MIKFLLLWSYLLGVVIITFGLSKFVSTVVKSGNTTAGAVTMDRKLKAKSSGNVLYLDRVEKKIYMILNY